MFVKFYLSSSLQILFSTNEPVLLIFFYFLCCPNNFFMFFMLKCVTSVSLT
jgi:hypothetical protein